ncbi:centromere protein F [Lolium rigidum]|uniref:centromere protein F n=1 Tax=Lolium rigidum TaxID=89674 RepID=UPI001F5D72D2|nr:centromere protein F [Lolium rigidum]
MDQKGRGRGRGGGGGGAGGRGGGDNTRTDLLAAGRKKLQQFRKKKEKKGPGKKSEPDADEGASSAAGANGEEPAPEPKSPVGLKFLAGEAPFEEAARVQEEQCNGQGPATVAENADVVPVLEDAGSGSVENTSSVSEQGNPEHGGPGPGDGQDSAVQATSSDSGADPVGAQPGDVDGEELPDSVSKESTEPHVSSQGDGAEDASNQIGEHQEVQVDSVETANSSDFEEIGEVPIPSQDSGAGNANIDEGAREMEVGVSGRPSDGSIQEDARPTVSAEVGVEAGHEEALALVASREIPGRGDTDGEADGMAKDAVQEDVGTSKTNAVEEAVTAELEKDLSVEQVDPILFADAVSQDFMPYHHEYIQSYLYTTTISRDFLRLHLDEVAHLNSDEILKLQGLLKESEESKVAVCDEIQQCRHKLSDMSTVKGELELIVASQKEEISTGNSKCEQLEIELQSSKENAQQILGELADCQSLLEALQKENMELTTNLALEKEARKEVEEQGEHLTGENKKLLSKLSDLELSLASVKEVMNAGSSRCESLEVELCSSKENMEHTLTELANFRALLETSQKDYFELSANYSIETEENKKLKEDNVCLHNEKEKLSSDLSELNDRLHVSYAKHKQLESHVRDTEAHMEQLKEQLIEESMHATNSFNIYQSVIKELDAKCNVVLGQAQTVVCQKNEHHPDSSEITVENVERAVTSPVFVSDSNDQHSHPLFNEKDSCKSASLRSLKGHLEVAKGELYELQKLVERVSSRSDGRVLVSKLIQSFEIKGNQEEPGMSEGEHDDLKKLTQEMISCLVEKFKLMTSDLTKTEKYVAELCDRIELSSKSEVEQEAERQRTAAFELKMDGLAEKLSNYKNTIDQLDIQLANVQQDADNRAGKLTDQAELLHNDVTERISILEKERASLSDLLSEVTNKLSCLRGTSPNDLGESEDLSFCILNSVDLAAKSIQSLQDKLEAGQTDNAKLNTSLSEIMKAHSDVEERNEHACRMVKSMYGSLQEFLCGSLGYSDEAGTGYNTEEPIEALLSHLGGTIEHLKNLLHDHHSLQSDNVNLESRLLSKCEELEELSLRCSSLMENMNDICLQNEELKLVSSSKSAALDELHGRCLSIAEKMVHHSAIPTSVVLLSVSSSEAETMSKEHHILNTLLPCIEEGVASYNEKLENAVEETHLSKICLQNAHIFDQISVDMWSLPLPVLIEEEILPKVCDLQAKIDQLSALNIQLETEAPVLRDGLKKLDEALEISRSELQKRSSELEQSEQKLSSVKEKLGIAVAKGKGLIVQRDGLKQSLSEKSGELEKLSQELQLKDALVKELEAKLKSYTEADRIEALESELSYIRNSATALRDSFILKDSVLQRIEEVLEDLDLPDRFHSRDIVEKIELLSKMAVGASFTMPDGDKRSSVDGHSESGAAMDSISDEQISNSNQGSDEMKNKYDELHRRFYELAEHNNMLEQSLVERNSIVQKWEEVLGQVSIPPQFRMLEPEDRIAWLGNRLLEVEQERDALHLKIEHLEDSSEMLITDLEESHKRISELSAEVVAVKAEKEFFSQSLDKLRFEFLGLSEKAVQDEFVRDNLRKDLAELQEKLAEKANECKGFHDLETEIHKLLDMVRNVLQDGSNTEIPSGDSGAVLCLGELLRKVLDHYETLLSESTLGNSAEKEIHLEEAKLSSDASTSEIGRDDKEGALNALSNELEHARRSLTLAEQQCDEAVEKAQSLTLEVEVLHGQINQLQEVGAEQTQKYQSLVLELESVGKQRDDLQEKLNQSNELEHARSSLVLAEQQRDEAVEKSHSLRLEVETAHAQINRLQEGGAEQSKKYESLVLELELAGKQRDDLQEKLNQEEQKCASLREKLNVAVRKGKGLVQQRDSLKKTIEEMNALIENLKNERKQHIESLESEKSFLMGRLSENEKSLHDTTQYLSTLLNALSMVDIAREFDTDPITKIGKVAQLYLDLQATATSSQNEVKKSKRATELLLAELNEAHERADNLQEELVMAEAALSESSKQNNVLESARADAVRHLEHITYMQAQAARKQIDHLKELNSTSGQLREVCFELSQRLVSAFSKDVDLICYMESFMKSYGKWMDGTNMVDIPITSNRLLSTSINSKKALIPNTPLEFTVDDSDGSQTLHHLAIACHAVSDCVKDCNDLKRNIDEHGFSIDQKATELSGIMSNLQSRFTSQNNELESLKENIVELQSEIKEKEEENLSMRRNMSLLYEACTNSVSEIEGMTGMGSGNRSYSVGQNHLSSDDHIKSVVEQLGAAVKTTRYSNEGNTKELKATVLELQQELQGKDVQISTISSELASQIREAESYAKQLSVELEDARMEIHNLEKHVEVLLNQKKALETQVSDLKDLETVASEQHGRIKELTDELSRKDQEIEGLMQALDEEEKELEILENKSNGLEQMLQEKEFALKSLEVSRTKALTKLATTVDKFDELHSLSESLLAEVESLQSQLQEKDSEISFLRQEVTRSTNELLTTEDSNKLYSSKINDFVKWLETALLQFGVHCEFTDDHDGTQVLVYMDMLDKKIGSLISESDDLRIAVQSKDSSLQIERTKMEELSRKSEALEASLSQKDSQIGLLRRDRISGQPSRSLNLPGTSEIEQMNDKVSPTAVGTQIRGARKVNNEQVAIDIEMHKDKPLDDEDDDKAHGFKSLTMSRIVPKFTRPISDRVDGMWVSGDRLLMRQPTLRLGVLLYWIALHALLASFI